MNSNPENPKKKGNAGEPLKQQTDCVLGWLNKLSAAFRVELSMETQAIYLQELREYPVTAIMKGCQRTLREWREASKMAPLSFVLERVESALADERMNSGILRRSDKPPDWEPMTREQADAFIKFLKGKAGNRP